MPTAAKTINTMEDLKIVEVGRKSIKATIAHVILMINAQMGTRRSTPWKICNKHVEYESDRKIFGIWRPRVSIDTRTDKTHKIASKVRLSEAKTLLRAIDCGCPEGEDHNKDSVMCEIPY